MSKNKFFKRLLVAGLCALTASTAIGMTACKKDDDKTPEKPPVTAEDQFTVTFDVDGGTWTLPGSVKVNSGSKVEKPASDPTKEGHDFVGWFRGDETEPFNFNFGITADVTLKAHWKVKTPQITVSFSMMGVGEVEAKTIDKGSKVKKPTDYTVGESYNIEGKSYKFGGWYTTAEYTTEFDFTQKIETATTVYGKWYETVESKVDLAMGVILAGGSGSGHKTTKAETIGKFTFDSGVYFESAHSNFGNKPVVNNQKKRITFTLSGEGTSNSIKFDCNGAQDLKIFKSDNTLVKSFENGENTVSREATGLEAGTYYISTSNSCRFGNIVITELLTVSNAESIIIAGGTQDFLVGSEFESNTLSVTLKYENGRQDSISTGFTVNKDAYKKDVAGTYPIKVSYKVGEQTFEKSYDVTVYGLEDLALGTNKIVKGANSAAGNGVYENHALRQFYFTGEQLSLDGLSVIAKGKVGNKEKDFILTEGYTYETTGTGNKKTVTVSLSKGGVSKSKTFEYYEAAKDNLATATDVVLSVDKTYEDAVVGTKNSSDEYQFKTIQQAVDFLNNAGLTKNCNKKLKLAAGKYVEKLEIKIPNLTIEGANRETTIIEYDSLYGIADEGGFIHTTDSTATLNVRDAAEGFTIKNVTVSNYWNSQEVFDTDLGENYPEHRALAILIQSDKFTMDNCKLLGYQDTIELFKGRQVIKNSYIAGTTDFIFGTNNTTYFYNCEIHSIANGKTDGGYVTAFKGANDDNGNGVVKYGAVFDGCHFTADAGVANNNTALGRPWGQWANVMIMNSVFDGHISKTAASAAGQEATKNQRYVDMSGKKPSLETVKFVEYNNTGDGAITASQVGVTVLTDAAAASKYNDLSVIFGAENGYSMAWDGNAGAVITTNVYNFAECGAQEGNWRVGTTEAPTSYFNGEITVVGQSKPNGNSLCFNTGAKVKFNVKGAISVTWFGGEYGTAADGKITYKGGYATLEIIGNNTPYIVSVTLDLTDIREDTPEEVPPAPDPSYADYLVNETINFGSAGNYHDYIDNGKLVVVASPTNGNFQDHATNTNESQIKEGATLTVKLKAGTVFTVSSHGGNTSYTASMRVKDGNEDVSLNGGAAITADSWTYEVTQDCSLTITSGSGNYFFSMSAECVTPIETDDSYVYAQNGRTDGEAEASTEKFQFSGCVVNNSWLYLNSDNSYIKLFVKNGANISVVTNGGKLTFAQNGVLQEVDVTSSPTVSYTATEDGFITIKRTAANSEYLRSITITYPAQS